MTQMHLHFDVQPLLQVAEDLGGQINLLPDLGTAAVSESANMRRTHESALRLAASARCSA